MSLSELKSLVSKMPQNTKEEKSKANHAKDFLQTKQEQVWQESLMKLSIEQLEKMVRVAARQPKDDTGYDKLVIETYYKKAGSKALPPTAFWDRLRPLTTAEREREAREAKESALAREAEAERIRKLNQFEEAQRRAQEQERIQRDRDRNR
jgi:hypothetical protein